MKRNAYGFADYDYGSILQQAAATKYGAKVGMI